MTEVLAPLILAHLVSAKSALLPVRAAEATLDDAPTLARLDAALRRNDTALLDVDATVENVAAARDAGVVCAATDRLCLGKLAALADVERMLSPVARRTRSGWHVIIVVVDAKAHAATLAADVGDPPAQARSLVERALSIALPDPSTIVTASSAAAPTSSSSVRAPATTSTSTSTSTAARAFTDVDVAAMVLAGAGAALMAGGVVAAGAMEVALQTPEPFADRTTKLFAGQAGVVALVAGAVAAGGGVAVEAARGYWPPSPSPSPPAAPSPSPSPPSTTTAVH